MAPAVLFDLFETLVTEARSRPTRASALGPRLGLHDVAFRREWKTRRPLVVLGRLSFAEALTEISNVLAGHVDADAVRTVCEERIRDKARAFADVDPAVAGMLTAIRESGVRLAVVSNCFAEDVRAWSPCPLSHSTDRSVFSFAIGAAKPSPEIYLHAVRMLGVEPDTAVFVGDGGDDELAGAERAGLRAYRCGWFDRGGHSRGWRETLSHPRDLVTRLRSASPFSG